MPAPYDYSGALGNPMQSFMEGLQISQALQQQRAAQEQARQKQARQAAMQAAVADWQIDRTPDKTANLLLQFPEMKEAITASQGVIDEATKKQDVDFAINSYGLL